MRSPGHGGDGPTALPPIRALPFFVIAVPLGLAGLVATVAALRLAVFNGRDATRQCMDGVDWWPRTVPLEDHPVTGHFSVYPLGLRCEWRAADGVFDTEMTSWPLSVLLTGGLGCLVLGFLAVLVGGLLAVRQVGSTRSGTVNAVTGSDQAVSRLPRELRELVASGPMAHLTTINADGSPQVTVMWIAVDGDDLVSAHMGWYAKLRNIDRDPRVVLSFDAPREPGVFMNPYAVVRARASIEPSEQAWDLLNSLAKVYIAPDAEFPAPKGPGFIIRYSVERIGGVGPWVSPA